MPLPTTPGKASGGAYTYTDCTSNCHMLVNMSAGQELELLPVIYKIHMSIYCFRFLICPFAKKVMFLFLKNIKDWNIEENHKIIAKNHYEKLERFCREDSKNIIIQAKKFNPSILNFVVNFNCKRGSVTCWYVALAPSEIVMEKNQH